MVARIFFCVVVVGDLLLLLFLLFSILACAKNQIRIGRTPDFFPHFFYGFLPFLALKNNFVVKKKETEMHS
jgi:hypothetical protein